MKRQRFLGSRAGLILTALLVLLLFSSIAFAQAGTSTIRGLVADPQGNVVAGATVTLINPATTASRTATTSDNGVFSFELVAVGDYRIEVEAKGFKKGVLTDVHALVAKATAVDVTLEVGSVSETVTVASGAGEVLVNRDDATIGNNFVNQQITQLPLEARNVLSLVTLQPGVTPEGYVNGARSDQSNITLDGVDINEAQTNSINSPVLRLNAEAIEEFRVTTSNPNANQGRSSGAQISLITKGGTNEWHGALFEAHRNTIFTANDFFNNRNGRFVATDPNVILGQNKVGDLRNPRPKLLRNTFGGALGGPIIKNRLFFFYSYEGRRDAAEQTVVRVVPLASLGRGELRYVNAGGGITTMTSAQLQTIYSTNGNTVGINPAAITALAQAAAKYPANDFTVGDSKFATQLNTAGFRFNASTPVALNSHTARFDLNLNDKQLLFLRANVIYDLVGIAPRFPDTPAPSNWSHPWGFVAGHTWTLTNTLVNNFRYGLTREAFSTGGDSTQNAISFRFIFSPLNFSRGRSRATPVHNITDDLSWVHGNHTTQFGTNIRLIRNHSVDFSSSFDNAITNPSFYAGGAGASISNAINAFFPAGSPLRIGPGFTSAVQNAGTALIGRFSQYSGVFSFNQDGTLKGLGTPNIRDFATEEYDGYIQDVWKMRPNLTLTAGLRYTISHPVYERNGVEVKTNIPLGDYFDRRVAAAANGTAFNAPITVDLSGKANGKSPLYNWDKNNFQPRVALAWSPRFKKGLLGKFFGTHDESVIRGGFAITNDYYGQQLAVSFDLNNTIGFVSTQTTAANTFNLTSRPGPLFTGFGQAVRTFPCSPRFCISIPAKVTFPNLQPADESPRIESSLDSRLVAPINYSWNATFEREMPHGLVVQTSYIGRYGKNLIASRDVMALNNIVDKKSGMDWYTAATQLELLRAKGIPITAVGQIPYFENLFPGLGDAYWGDPSLSATQAVYKIATDFFGNDWTDTQFEIDDFSILGPNLFFQPQYGALATFSSVGRSWYHAGTVSVRERLGTDLTLDFNYTLSHSLDDASGLQTSGGYGAAFILNPLRQNDWYADSDFDIRHVINLNAVWRLPVGRGRWLFSNANSLVNGLVGGWQLSGIYRWNSGLPISAPYDDVRWATNWNVQSYNVRMKPLKACPDKGGANAPKLFGCDPTGIYRSFRNALPGESGDRAPFRLPGYASLDLGLGKEFAMPWSEHQKLQIRWEVFNLTNTQRMGAIDGSRTGYGITADPAGRPIGCTPGVSCVAQDGTGSGSPATPPTNWSNFTGIQGSPRVMQVGLRFSF